MSDRGSALPAEELPPNYLALGLTGAQVAERLARGQVNRAARSVWRDYVDILIRNVATLFNAMVVPAAVALFVLGDYRSAWAVSAYAVINTLIGLVQESRAKRHLDSLAIHAALKVCVLRDGAPRVISADEIVLDDHIKLAAGDTVAADGVVLTAQFLEMDEALLTGESDPVARRAGDRLLSGSVCVAGQGSYRADKIGNESFAQQTSLQARRYQFSPSPMQRIVDTIIRALTATALILCGIYVALYYARGFPQTQLWQMIAATVTSMVPQGLVLITTLTFALGAARITRLGAIVQRLNAIESMASVDVICMDKTGTLTTNNLRLDRVRAIRNNDEAARDCLRLFAWASIDAANKSIAAIRSALGTIPDAQRPSVLEQTPFKSQNRFSAVRVRVVDDGEQVLVLGAVEALRPFMEGALAVEAEAAWREMLPSGLRLLLYAVAENPVGLRPLGDSLQGIALRPLALLGLSDELRPDAEPVLEALSAQGVSFKILSGDHPDTIRATIRHLRLPFAHESVITQDQLDAAVDRTRVICESSMFGRVTPRRKLDIVTTLQAVGHRVGMIGDGVNDILAIKRSDLGIAMGSGVSATKTVAGLVLEHNDFALLPAALDEGRTILRNLRRVAKIFLLKNVYSFFLIVFGLGFLGLDFPYLPQQVTLLNTLTIGVPALLMMWSKAQARRPTRFGFLREVGSFVLVSGLIVGTAGLTIWLVSARWNIEGLETQRTLLLTTLIVLGLGNLLIVSEGEARTRWWAIGAAIAYAIVMHVSPLAHFFALTPLSIAQWTLVAAISAMALVAGAIAGRIQIKRGSAAQD